MEHLRKIEEASGYIKGYLKKHDDIAAAFPNPTSLIRSAFDSITVEHADQCISQSASPEAHLQWCNFSHLVTPNWLRT